MRLRFFKKILLAGMVVASPNAVSAEILGIQYEGFKIWIDCETKSAIRWKYTARKNRGNYRPSERYFQSPDIPSRCQQTSVNAYQTKREQVKYVRGQLVPAKAMNSNKIALKQTNTMTNVLPQVEQMNRGAWRET